MLWIHVILERGMQEYFATLQIRQVDNKIEQKRSKCAGRMAMTRPISQQISCLFGEQTTGRHGQLAIFWSQLAAKLAACVIMFYFIILIM